MGRILRNRMKLLCKIAGLLIVIAVLLTTGFSVLKWLFYLYSLLSLNEYSATPDRTKCFHINFSQEEVDNICSPEEKWPFCLVNKIDHLNQNEFVPADMISLSPNSQGRLNIFVSLVVFANSLNIKLYVHPPWDVNSRSFMSQGFWELTMERCMRAALLAEPDAALLDIGSQLGAFSLRAAEMGRKVIAIDAFHQNVIRLKASVSRNKFDDRVQVYWNALAAESGSMVMHLPRDCNVDNASPRSTAHNGHLLVDSIKVRNSRLQDIVLGGNGFHGVKNLAIKIGIKDNEWLEVMASDFSRIFHRFNVTMVMMKWMGTKLANSERGPEIISLFQSHNLQPYAITDIDHLFLMPTSDYMNWPLDVVWLKRVVTW